MLLKSEFEANMSFLEPSIESMLAAGQGKFDIKGLCHQVAKIKDSKLEFECLAIRLLYNLNSLF